MIIIINPTLWLFHRFTFNKNCKLFSLLMLTNDLKMKTIIKTTLFEVGAEVHVCNQLEDMDRSWCRGRLMCVLDKSNL